MMRKILISALASAIALSSAAPVFAQQGPPAARYDDKAGLGNPHAAGGAPSEEKREEIRKKIEAVRIWRLTEALKLDGQTSSKLSALLGSCEHRRKGIMREQTVTMREIRHALTSTKPDTSKIKTALDKLEKSRHAMQELRDEELSGVKSILTVEQQARFLLFQQDFRHEMQGIIDDARRGGAGRSPGGEIPGKGDPGVNRPGRSQAN
jgi:Spy/CpxP family protein refolding chaperone